MAFTNYITYDEYEELGGTVSEDEFTALERKARRYVDAFTFGRVQLLSEIPDEVKDVMVDFITKLDNFSKQSSDGATISQYSNGVEQITYRRNTEHEVVRTLQASAISWLPNYLVNRSVKFDVRDYLQSNNNNP